MQWKNLLLKKSKPTGRKPDEDRAILFICMGIALLFWIFIKLSKEYSARKRITFQVEIPTGRTITEELPKDIYVELDGSGWDLLYEFFNASSIVIPYQVSNSDNTFSRSRTQLRNDIQNQLKNRSLGIQSFNLDVLEIGLADLVQKRIPVRPKVQLRFAPGFQLTSPITLSPDSVILTGPAPILAPLTDWPTDSLVEEDLQNSFVTALSLEKAPAVVQIEPSSVEIQANVEQFTETSVFVPIQIQNLPDSNLRVFPNNLSVSCIVGLSRYNEINSNSFKFIVDFAGIDISTENNTVPIRLDSFPNYVRNINFSPQVATYFVFKDSLSQN